MEKFKRWLLNTFFKNELIKIYKDYSDEVKKLNMRQIRKTGILRLFIEFCWRRIIQ